jgi:hypothetical protein
MFRSSTLEIFPSDHIQLNHHLLEWDKLLHCVICWTSIYIYIYIKLSFINLILLAMVFTSFNVSLIPTLSFHSFAFPLSNGQFKFRSIKGKLFPFIAQAKHVKFQEICSRAREGLLAIYLSFNTWREVSQKDDDIC